MQGRDERSAATRQLSLWYLLWHRLADRKVLAFTDCIRTAKEEPSKLLRSRGRAFKVCICTGEREFVLSHRNSTQQTKHAWQGTALDNAHTETTTTTPRSKGLTQCDEDDKTTRCGRGQEVENEEKKDKEREG